MMLCLRRAKQVIILDILQITRDDTDFALTAVYNHAAKLVDDCKNALILSGKIDGEALKTEREEILRKHLTNQRS